VCSLVVESVSVSQTHIGLDSRRRMVVNKDAKIGLVAILLLVVLLVVFWGRTLIGTGLTEEEPASLGVASTGGADYAIPLEYRQPLESVAGNRMCDTAVEEVPVDPMEASGSAKVAGNCKEEVAEAPITTGPKGERIPADISIPMPTPVSVYDISIQAPGAEDAVTLAEETVHIEKIYIVQSGDTLRDIAIEMYGEGKKWREIAIANKLTNPNVIRPGSKLVIPTLVGVDASAEPTVQMTVGRQEHVVSRGETLSGIAKHFYGMESGWKLIADENGIEDPTKLRVGQKLIIPEFHSSVAREDSTASNGLIGR